MSIAWWSGIVATGVNAPADATASRRGRGVRSADVSALDVCILGPLRVRADDVPVTFGRRSERALLVLLALSPDQVVSSTRLAEDLWPAGAPATAATALRVYVSRLRRKLGAHGPVLVTRPPGYCLAVAPEAVDAVRFELLARQGREHAAAGRPAEAAHLLGQATALWRGALAEVAEAPLARAEAARLEELRLGVLEDRIEADLACGRHRAVLSELETHTLVHPLRERFWGLRMLALYRDERQAEALDCFQQLRRLLATELGIEPGAGARALQEAILGQNPALSALQVRNLAVTTRQVDLGLPLPARLPLRPEFGFRGREAEVGVLDTAYRAVAAGARARSIVWVSGEPGAGKSTLVAQFARTVHERGATVLYGRCEEEDLTLPYQPFAEGLQHYLRHAAEPILREHVEEYGPDLAILAPALRRRLASLPAARSADPDTSRYLLFGAVAGLLATAAGSSAVVLVLDDLHRSDRPTIALLRHLLTEHGPSSLLVVATFRNTEVPDDHPLRALLVATASESTPLSLTGLSPAAVRTLTETALEAADIDAPGLAETLFEETGGNPFFVIELLRHIAESAGSPQPGTIGATLPRSVGEVVTQRVARLGADAVAVLHQAAVIGRDVEVAVLSRALNRDEEDVLEVLEPAAAAALLTETAPGRYCFTHAVIAQTIYDGLSASRRTLAHRRVAAALEQLEGPVPRAAELARHWVAAVTSPMEAAAALEHAERAAQAAMTSLGFEEAIRWYEQTLALLAAAGGADQRRRAALLIGLGRAQRLAGNLGSRQTLLDAARLARSIGDTDALVRAVLANHRGFFTKWGEVDGEKIEMISAALDALDRDSPEKARLLALLMMEQTYGAPWPQRRALAEQAEAMARRLGDPDTVAAVTTMMYFAMSVPETLPARLAATAEAVESAERQSDPALRHWAHRIHLYTRVESGDLAHLATALPVITATANASADPLLLWGAGFLAGWQADLAGDLERAEALSMAAFHRYVSAGFDQAESAALQAMQLMAIRRPQGRWGELRDGFVEAVRLSPGVHLLRAFLALLHLDAGADEEARALLRADAADGFAGVPYELTWLMTMANYAEVAAALQEHEIATHLYDALAPWPDQLTYWYFINGGVVAYYLGLLAASLGHHEQADAHFAAAASAHDGFANPFWAAQTRLEWARMLASRDGPKDGARAADLVARVRETAHRFDFAGLLRQTDSAAFHHI
jgi:DNA-binding SARP family transcriptional activator